MTLTEQLRRGIVATGWARTTTQSGRECYSKQHIDGKTGKPFTLYLWLGTAGSLRWSDRNAFTSSQVLGRAAYDKIFTAGAMSPANLLKGLES
jgi:hypothetical protein